MNKKLLSLEIFFDKYPIEKILNNPIIAEKYLPTSLTKLEENTKSLFANCNLIDSPKIDKNQNIVIKVRTESFDQKNN